MNNKKTLLIVFIVVAIVQLAVPAKMIWDKERVFELGKEFKFETAPVDPTDPFRGKYIVLEYKESSVAIDSESDWKEGQSVYVHLKADRNGFAKIESVSKEKPIGTQDFVKAKVEFIGDMGYTTMNIAYPFDRFYMEESMAFEAEQQYIKSQIDSTKITYALVNIRDGEAVLKDVHIDGVSISEIVKKNRLEE